MCACACACVCACEHGVNNEAPRARAMGVTVIMHCTAAAAVPPLSAAPPWRRHTTCMPRWQHTHAHTRAHTHAHAHTCVRARTRTHTRVRARDHACARTHARTHKRTCDCVCARTHTTHAHTRALSLSLSHTHTHHRRAARRHNPGRATAAARKPPRARLRTEPAPPRLCGARTRSCV